MQVSDYRRTTKKTKKAPEGGEHEQAALIETAETGELVLDGQSSLRSTPVRPQQPSSVPLFSRRRVHQGRHASPASWDPAASNAPPYHAQSAGGTIGVECNGEPRCHGASPEAGLRECLAPRRFEAVWTSTDLVLPAILRQHVSSLALW